MTVAAASPLAWAVDAVRLPGGRPFVPYPYQAALLTDRSPRQLVLKARQTGITFTAALRIAHDAIFRPRSLSLVISRDQAAAANVLTTIYGILDELDEPPELVKANAYEAVLSNGSRIVSQPATAKAGRGYTATSVVLDEYAFCDYADRIYRAVTPTLSRGGMLTVISTPNGVNNPFAQLWLGGDGWNRHKIHWSDCPAFDGGWYAKTRPDYSAAAWASEFECDFIESGGAVFSADDVDAMRDGWHGLRSPEPGRRYVHAWDIGRRNDPTVGVTLDATTLPYQVVAYERLVRAPFAVTEAAIARRHGRYGGVTWVEANSIGDPVIEALTCRVSRFNTTAKSKADALTALVRVVEQGSIKGGVVQLLSELKAYQWDDQNIVQDSVMALAIAVHGASHKPGRLRALGSARQPEVAAPFTIMLGGNQPPPEPTFARFDDDDAW